MSLQLPNLIEIAPLFDNDRSHENILSCSCNPIVFHEYIIHRRMDGNVDYRPVVVANHVEEAVLIEASKKGFEILAKSSANIYSLSFEVFMDLMYVGKVLTSFSPFTRVCDPVCYRPGSNDNPDNVFSRLVAKQYAELPNN